jgi:hypothetical protein
MNPIMTVRLALVTQFKARLWQDCPVKIVPETGKAYEY